MTLSTGWVEHSVPGDAGTPDVRIQVHGARAGPARPAILHMHGGGFVGGSTAIAAVELAAIALAIDCVIVSVDYRLAPATPFPGALNDNYRALAWLHGNADDLGVDRARIAVLGESAGGGHAAMLAIAARDRGELSIAFQALIYPMLDDRIRHSAAGNPDHFNVLTWTPEENAKGWSALLGVDARSVNVPAGAVPARVENLRGLPPTYIAVGSADFLVDENIVFARRLIEQDVEVELNVVPGAFHGFDIFAPDANVSHVFRTRLVSALRQALCGASSRSQDDR